MRILVVEDDCLLSAGLVELLEEAGHEPRLVEDGREAVFIGLHETHDLLLLDRMLPNLDGLEVCKRIRTAKPGIAAIMLTARGTESERVQGLREGLDDYIVKPFSARELLARIEALGRRLSRLPEETEVLELFGKSVDLSQLKVFEADRPVVTLTPREVGIIRLLHRHRNRAVSRAELLEEVWGVPGHLATRTVDMAILGLRQKIEGDPKEPKTVLSVTGVGYVWAEPDG